MKCAVEGIGLLGSFGFGLPALAERFCAAYPHRVASLAESEPMPGNSMHAEGRKREIPLALPKTDTAKLAGYLPPRALRQLDHFTRMALVGAYAAATDAALTPEQLAKTGIVLVTGYGPAQRTFDFLDSLLEFGPEMASPLAFSHSVHNIPAAEIALKMHIPGPCATVRGLDNCVGAGLDIAEGWLEEERVEYVLFGAVEEHTPLLQDVTSRLAGKWGAHGRSAFALGEASVFFCLSGDPARARLGTVKQTLLTGGLEEKPSGPCFLTGAVPKELRGRPENFDGRFAYGNLPVAAALDMALGIAAVQGDFAPMLSCQDTVECLDFVPAVESRILPAGEEMGMAKNAVFRLVITTPTLCVSEAG